MKPHARTLELASEFPCSPLHQSMVRENGPNTVRMGLNFEELVPLVCACTSLTEHGKLTQICMLTPTDIRETKELLISRQFSRKQELREFAQHAMISPLQRTRSILIMQVGGSLIRESIELTRLDQFTPSCLMTVVEQFQEVFTLHVEPVGCPA